MLPQTVNSKNEANACKFSTSMAILWEDGVTMSLKVTKPKAGLALNPRTLAPSVGLKQYCLSSGVAALPLHQINKYILSWVFRWNSPVFKFVCFKLICSTMSGSDQPQLPPYVIPGNLTCLSLFLYWEDNAKQDESVLLLFSKFINLVENAFPIIPMISWNICNCLSLLQLMVRETMWRFTISTPPSTLWKALMSRKVNPPTRTQNTPALAASLKRSLEAPPDLWPLQVKKEATSI